jgi:hypothetical protein
VSLLVEALRYKPEERGFDSQWYNWNFSYFIPSGLTMALGSESETNIIKMILISVNFRVLEDTNLLKVTIFSLIN